MSGFRIFWRIALTLLFVGLLIAGGVALYRSGWSQGYQAGVIAAGAVEGTAELSPGQLPYYPVVPFAYGPHFGYPGFFSPFSVFLWIGFFLLLFFLIGGLFRAFSWRRWGGWKGGPAYSGHPGHGGGYGPPPPWGRDWQEQYERWSKEHGEEHESPSEPGKTENE
jgi:hypothetical protein